MTNFILIGHRGAAGITPENTLISIREALIQGVDRVEIDVQQTADNVIIALHDKTLDRTTTGKGYVKNQSYAVITNFYAGKLFDPTFKTAKIPRLEEVLTTINGKAKLLIDIKYGHPYYPNIEQRIWKIIKDQKAEDWCIIQSFSDAILKRFHALDSKIRLCKLFVGKVPFLPIVYDNQLRYGTYNTFKFVQEISIYYPFINEQTIKQIHQQHKKIIAWTVNDVNHAKMLLQLGLDGIVTDYPHLLSQLRG